MGEAHEMARRILREQEKVDAKKAQLNKDLKWWAGTLLILGVVIATMGMAFDQVGILIVGSIIVVFGGLVGIFWATADR
jgi:hypothetical protein